MPGLEALNALIPKCPHGVDVRAHCPQCTLRASVETLDERMARLGRVDTSVRLSLPSARGHVARASRAKGSWTVCCSCGVKVIRSAVRHDVEVAWNEHAGGKS